MQSLGQGAVKESVPTSHIALVPSMGLGDSLIYVLLAVNLARAGYRVTMLSNHLAYLAEWLPQLEILPFPSPDQTEALYEAYDVIIADCGGIVAAIKRPALELAQKFIFVGTLKVKADYIFDHTERLRLRLGIDKAAHLAHLAKAAGPIRVIPDDRVTMVDQTVAFCRERLCLSQASTELGLVLPAHIQHRLYRRRVMLHPTSYNAKKNWPWQKYLRLARRLRESGYEPEFVLSPKERTSWAAYFEAEFPVPHLADTKALAIYLYESGFVIGNDSGVGHLASALGVPVLTIYRKRRDGFCWRPGWGDNEVVRPWLSLGALRQAWMYCLSVTRVKRAFDRLVSRHEVHVAPH